MNSDLYKNKYRIQTTRLRGWDYSSSGWYFITVVCQNREHYFGEIIDDEMHYTETGHAAASAWLAMQRVFDVLIPDVWVIMPNHTHFLFALSNPKEEYEPSEFKKMVQNSVASIINHFKGRVTKYANKENIEFAWQERFHDRIIRNQKEFKTIQNYIINNPQNWDKDKYSL